MTTFTGVLAVLHTNTPDGRRLDEPGPELSRPTPLPLVRPGEPGIGRIDRVWRDGDLIRYSGELDDEHPEAEKTAADIRAGRLVGMLDADGVGNTEYLYQGRPVSDGEEIPLDAGARDVTVTMRGWRVAAATLMPSEGKAWPEVSLTLGSEETGT
jgi:hypothetical protein